MKSRRCDHERNEKRPEQRAGLIERLMRCERHAASRRGRSLREHRVARRRSDCLAEAFGYEQYGRRS